MKRYSIFLCSLFLIFVLAVNVNAVNINYNGLPYDDFFGDSWDNPSDELGIILSNLYEMEDITLNLINYGEGGVETFYGMGVESIILEENAGYADYTTFGYYAYTDDGMMSGEIFNGSASSPDSYPVTFDELTDFGFYIFPNGILDDRMFTEHAINSHEDYQVAIFNILNADLEPSNQYILGWEDLDLEGGSGGDRDYQDMIVHVTINSGNPGNPGNPVPEPATMLLLGTGLIGLGGAGRKRFFK